MLVVLKLEISQHTGARALVPFGRESQIYWKMIGSPDPISKVLKETPPQHRRLILSLVSGSREVSDSGTIYNKITYIK